MALPRNGKRLVPCIFAGALLAPLFQKKGGLLKWVHPKFYNFAWLSLAFVACFYRRIKRSNRRSLNKFGDYFNATLRDWPFAGSAPVSNVSIAHSREKVNIEFSVPDSSVLWFLSSQVLCFCLSGISANLLVFESVCAAAMRLLSVCGGTCLPVFSGSLFTFCEETRNPLQSQCLCATMSTAQPSSSGQRGGKVVPSQTP